MITIDIVSNTTGEVLETHRVNDGAPVEFMLNRARMNYIVNRIERNSADDLTVYVMD